MMKIAASYDESDNVRLFRVGDTVRRGDHDGSCVVIWAWDDWLWLDPVEPFDAAPFTGRADDYSLIRRLS